MPSGSNTRGHLLWGGGGVGGGGGGERGVH